MKAGTELGDTATVSGSIELPLPVEILHVTGDVSYSHIIKNGAGMLSGSASLGIRADLGPLKVTLSFKGSIFGSSKADASAAGILYGIVSALTHHATSDPVARLLNPVRSVVHDGAFSLAGFLRGYSDVSEKVQQAMHRGLLSVDNAEQYRNEHDNGFMGLWKGRVPPSVEHELNRLIRGVKLGFSEFSAITLHRIKGTLGEYARLRPSAQRARFGGVVTDAYNVMITDLTKSVHDLAKSVEDKIQQHADVVLDIVRKHSASVKPGQPITMAVRKSINDAVTKITALLNSKIIQDEMNMLLDNVAKDVSTHYRLEKHHKDNSNAMKIEKVFFDVAGTITLSGSVSTGDSHVGPKLSGSVSASVIPFGRRGSINLRNKDDPSNWHASYQGVGFDLAATVGDVSGDLSVTFKKLEGVKDHKSDIFAILTLGVKLPKTKGSPATLAKNGAIISMATQFTERVVAWATGLMEQTAKSQDRQQSSRRQSTRQLANAAKTGVMNFLTSPSTKTLLASQVIGAFKSNSLGSQILEVDTTLQLHVFGIASHDMTHTEKPRGPFGFTSWISIDSATKVKSPSLLKAIGASASASVDVGKVIMVQ
jgi:hypothetical protein